MLTSLRRSRTVCSIKESLVGRQALRYVHKLMHSLNYGHCAPSPFAMPGDDRAWLRLLKVAAWRSSERATYMPPDYKDAEHGVAQRLTEGGACHTPGGSHPSAGNCQNRDYCSGSGQEQACCAAFEAFWPRTLQQMAGEVLSLSEPTRPPLVMSATPMNTFQIFEPARGWPC